MYGRTSIVTADSRKAIGRFIIWITTAIVLLGLNRFSPDGPFSGLAIGGFALISGPIFVLAALDVGRALRREPLNTEAATAARVPEFLLGSIACVAGAGGVALAFWGGISPPWQIYGTVVSVAMFFHGAVLLHRIGISWKSANAESKN